MKRKIPIIILTLLLTTPIDSQAIDFKINIIHEDNKQETRSVTVEQQAKVQLEKAEITNEFRIEFSYNKLKRDLNKVISTLEDPVVTTTIPKSHIRRYRRDVEDIHKLIEQINNEIVRFEKDKSKKNKVMYDIEIESKRKQINKLLQNISNYKPVTEVAGSYEYLSSSTWKKTPRELTKTSSYSTITEEEIGGWIPMKTYTRFTSGYGYRKNPFGIILKNEFHAGIDIAAPKETPIYSLDDGVIIEAKYHYSLGNYVKIRMSKDDSVDIIYGHMTKSIVDKGDIVYKGQVVGYVGSTGRSTGPHLHIGAKENNKFVNPSKYIQ